MSVSMSFLFLCLSACALYYVCVCLQNFEEIVKVLVEKKADINLRDSMGNTPLHVVFGGSICGPPCYGDAFVQSKLEKTRILTQNGASSNALNNFPYCRPLGDSLLVGNLGS